MCLFFCRCIITTFFIVFILLFLTAAGAFLQKILVWLFILFAKSYRLVFGRFILAALKGIFILRRRIIRTLFFFLFIYCLLLIFRLFLWGGFRRLGSRRCFFRRWLLFLDSFDYWLFNFSFIYNCLCFSWIFSIKFRFWSVLRLTFFLVGRKFWIFSLAGRLTSFDNFLDSLFSNSNLWLIFKII